MAHDPQVFQGRLAGAELIGYELFWIGALCVSFLGFFLSTDWKSLRPNKEAIEPVISRWVSRAAADRLAGWSFGLILLSVRTYFSPNLAIPPHRAYNLTVHWVT